MAKAETKSNAKDRKDWANKTPPADTQANSGPAARDAVQETKKPIAALLISSWRAREAGVLVATHEVSPEVGTPIDNLLRREFWANIAAKLHAGDTIIVWPRDAAYYVELLVWAVGANYADVVLKMDPILRPELAAAPGIAQEFDIFRDPLDGLCVKRRSTGEIVKRNLVNSADAANWIRDHQLALRT